MEKHPDVRHPALVLVGSGGFPEASAVLAEIIGWSGICHGVVLLI
jgi:hypothetical protein